MILKRLLVTLLASLALSESMEAVQVALEGLTLTDVEIESTRTTEIARMDALNQIDRRRFEEVVDRHITEMTTLVEFAIVSLSIAPSLSTLGSAPVDGQEVVSYNQWLASSFVSSPSAVSMQVAGVTLRVSASVRNSNSFIGITESTSGRPDAQRIVARMDSSILSTMPLNAAMNVALVPESGSDPGILLPDREYWVVFGVEDYDHEESLTTGLYHWSYTKSAGPYDSGTEWSVGSRTATGNTSGQNWASAVQSPQSYSVTLSPIPEPDVTLLFLTSLMMICFKRCRLR